MSQETRYFKLIIIFHSQLSEDLFLLAQHVQLLCTSLECEQHFSALIAVSGGQLFPEPFVVWVAVLPVKMHLAHVLVYQVPGIGLLETMVLFESIEA
jgi:hypothetical protein